MGKESFLNVNVKVWRQRGPKEKGEFKTYRVEHVSTEMSFFEMMDTLNEQLINKHEEPIVFDHDCREGICGTCSLYINGRPHGIDDAITTCQLHMRKFKNEETITVEPWRSAGFPVIRDLMVDRSACGACVAACKNGSAMLFVSAKVSQFALLPQGKVEAARRAKAMVARMDELGFGNCTNTRACEMECPKSVKISNIARLNREFIKAKLAD